jgi:hypothetical protein
LLVSAGCLAADNGQESPTILGFEALVLLGRELMRQMAV